MRLFIAVLLEEPVKDILCEQIDSLKKKAVQGTFTRRENLHLTLVFLGETNRISDIRRVMNAVEQESFDVSMNQMGRFRRPGGDIYWMGLGKSPALESLYQKLYRELCQLGFSLEDRPFQPHLTVGRQVLLEENISLSVLKSEIQVRKISLMKSERINGRLTYTPVYEKILGRNRDESKRMD